jgi:hypothetical protein
LSKFGDYELINSIAVIIEKYATQLAWLMQHDEERQTMARHAIESSKRFQLHKIIEQWLKLFEKL